MATVLALAKNIGKVAVVSGACYGFIGNRMLESYLREAEFLLEGAAPAQVDRALKAFAMAMGPCRMIDIAGVDVAATVVAERGNDGKLPADPNYRTCFLHQPINEGARILEEGIGFRADDVDFAWLNGYGFPTLEGRPMHAADAIGPEQIEACLDHYAAQRGNVYGYWRVAALLRDMAVPGRRFGEACP